jgi:hypothetical protein
MIYGQIKEKKMQVIQISVKKSEQHACIDLYLQYLVIQIQFLILHFLDDLPTTWTCKNDIIYPICKDKISNMITIYT